MHAKTSASDWLPLDRGSRAHSAHRAPGWDAHPGDSTCPRGICRLPCLQPTMSERPLFLDSFLEKKPYRWQVALECSSISYTVHKQSVNVMPGPPRRALDMLPSVLPSLLVPDLCLGRLLLAWSLPFKIFGWVPIQLEQKSPSSVFANVSRQGIIRPHALVVLGIPMPILQAGATMVGLVVLDGLGWTLIEIMDRSAGATMVGLVVSNGFGGKLMEMMAGTLVPQWLGWWYLMVLVGLMEMMDRNAGASIVGLAAGST